MSKRENELKIKIDPESARPVYEQIKQGIQVAILSGQLKKEDKLLPIRTFAKQLKVNPNTIVKVYYQLDVEGFLYSKPGMGYYVKGTRDADKTLSGEIFKSITEEYVSKGSKLGFAITDMIKSLELYSNKKTEEDSDK